MNPSHPQPRCFYWELDEPHRSEAHAVALEDEAYLATDLLRGAALLAIPYRHDHSPTQVLIPRPEVDADAYPDVIASILQLAAWNGLDLGEVLEHAMEQQRGLYAFSACAALQRENATPPASPGEAP